MIIYSVIIALHKYIDASKKILFMITLNGFIIDT